MRHEIVVPSRYPKTHKKWFRSILRDLAYDKERSYVASKYIASKPKQNVVAVWQKLCLKCSNALNVGQ